VLTKTVRQFLDSLSGALGINLDPDDIPGTLGKLGAISRILNATVRNTANPTMLNAGYKSNVIPGSAVGYVDGRFLPGQEEEFVRELHELVGPGIEQEWEHFDQAVETTFDGSLVDAMVAALRAEDPTAYPVPFMMSGGTDAKSFERLGMRCFGFAPLRLPPELDFAALFHGIDERVPVEGLRFGVRVLDRLLGSC
jgi:acetylornithine deacetylase/succinyl-diaminopimelate desuccinylase-like protein